MHAVVLTGQLLSGMEGQQVWAKVSALLKLEPQAFIERVLARTPLSRP